MEDHVCALFNEGICNGLCSGRIVEAACIVDQNLHIRVNVLCAGLITCCKVVDQWVVYAADEADHFTVV